MPRLDEVYKKSGVPTHTFVAPSEYARVLVALQTPGRGIIVEGPSGIGKTSCVKKALEDSDVAASTLFLSARKADDLQIIVDLPNMGKIGIVVVDDFHRLDDPTKKKLADYTKILADEESADSKIILIGINRAGQTLVEYAPDVLHRIESIRFGRTNIEKLREMIALGERALNCDIAIAEDIANEAEGSFAMAQVLCHEACLQDGVVKTVEANAPKKIAVSLPSIRETVLADLSPRFFPISREFATGNKLRREGRAPYLNLLRWLSQTPEGALDSKEAVAQNPELKGSVGQVIEKGYLSALIGGSQPISDLIHFEPITQLLTAEDPKFLYYIRHLIWSSFARQVGYFTIDFKSQYDFALSFAGQERDLAAALTEELVAREIVVFYDKNEQYRILGNDVEEYLAPIYRSESRFVVALLSNSYPGRIWTKFESEQFKHRFGQNSVIPIWFSDCTPGMFDESRKVGGLTFDTKEDLKTQAASIADILARMLEEDRQVAALAPAQPDPEQNRDLFEAKPIVASAARE
jgi:hypothetical protein